MKINQTFTFACAIFLAWQSSFSEQIISITGKVIDEASKPVSGAVVSLATAGYTVSTDATGQFTIDNSSPVQPRSARVASTAAFSITGSILNLSIPKQVTQVRFELFDLRGRMLARHIESRLAAGSYRITIAGLLSQNLRSATCLVRVYAGAGKFSGKLSLTGNQRAPFSIRSSSETAKAMAKSKGTLDSVIVSKFGYSTASKAITAYTGDVGSITISKILVISSNNVQSLEDSLFRVLLDRIDSLDSLDGPDELKALDFISLRNAFETILENDSTRVKSNVGYMASSLLSLNTSSKVWKLVDSLDAYFTDVDNYFNGDTLDSNVVLLKKSPSLLRKSALHSGTQGLGKALTIKAPDMLLDMTRKPSFPKFVSLAYLQSIIKGDVIPAVNNVIAVSDRLLGLDSMNLMVDVEGDSFDVDMGEIYMVKAEMHLLRAWLALLCAYDMDMYTSNALPDYSWIDSLIDSDVQDTTIYRLKGDTLMEINHWDDSEIGVRMARTFKYNLEERTSFMTIKNQYHSMILADLRAVPSTMKKGILAIRAETDNQDNDVIQISMMQDMDADMLDFSTEMRNEGVSAELAEKFGSPETLMDFISEILAGPYTFNETIDSQKINLTVNLSAFFTSPVTDLRTLLPKYTWTSESEWVKTESDMYSSSPTGSPSKSFEVWDDAYKVDIDSALIDSMVASEWGGSRIYLNTTFTARVSIDSSAYLDPLRLTDADGKVITFEEIDSLIDNKTFMPYFSDYTFNGIFPDMTRAKWLELIWGK